MNLKEFLRTHGLTSPVDGKAISTTAGRKELCKMFGALGFRNGAEIGGWQGRFSEQICLANPGVRLICVDPWKAYDDYGDPKNVQSGLDEAMRLAVVRLKPYGCEIRKQTSTEAADAVPDGSLDFVYLDGNHGKAYVMADLDAWVPKVRSGGIISGHDYEVKKRHAHLQVREAVDDYAKIHKIAPIYILTNDKTPSFMWVKP